MGAPSSIGPLSQENIENVVPFYGSIQCEEKKKMSEMTSIHLLQSANFDEGWGRSSKRKKNREDKGPMETICSWIVEHQIGLPVNLLALLFLTHLCFPRARLYSRRFFQLSYLNTETGEYGLGWNDGLMVLYWIVMFTGLRATVMNYCLMELAKKGGIKSKRGRTRFAEQGWLFIYYFVFWSLGMYIMINSEYWMNFRELWTDWPSREIGGFRKWYILVQFAFWLQQIMVINVEERRKDHWQMFIHHIVTSVLIFTSYVYHHTRAANMILCLMDVGDIILPIAKCLRYLGYTTLCDFVFGLFMLVWFVTRHIMYMMLCWSAYKDTPETIPQGCFHGKTGNLIGPYPSPDRFHYLLRPFYDPNAAVCYTKTIMWSFLTTLLVLQGITLMWFWMIVQVALRVLRGGQANDSRSDDDDEYTEEEIIDEVNDSEIRQNREVNIESVKLRGKIFSVGRSRYGKKGSSHTSGVSLPGHMDRKDLLGRIGCDKTM